MDIWTTEEEAERLKSRFAHINRAAFARDNNLKGGQALIYQHINGVRKISREAALTYAKGFGVKLEEISPRLAKEAREVVAQNQPYKSMEDMQYVAFTATKIQQHPLIKQVIDLMEDTDDQGKEAILVAARSASHVRMVQRAEIEKMRREVADIQAVMDANDDADQPVFSRSVAPVRKAPPVSK